MSHHSFRTTRRTNDKKCSESNLHNNDHFGCTRYAQQVKKGASPPAQKNVNSSLPFTRRINFGAVQFWVRAPALSRRTDELRFVRKSIEFCCRVAGQNNAARRGRSAPRDLQQHPRRHINPPQTDRNLGNFEFLVVCVGVPFRLFWAPVYPFRYKVCTRWAHQPGSHGRSTKEHLFFCLSLFSPSTFILGLGLP